MGINHARRTAARCRLFSLALIMLFFTFSLFPDDLSAQTPPSSGNISSDKNSSGAITGKELSTRPLVAADKGHAWIVLQQGELFRIYHHAPGESYFAWRSTDSFSREKPEQITCFASGAVESQLTLVFPRSKPGGERPARRKSAEFEPVTKRWIWHPAGRLFVLPSLPGDASLTDLKYSSDGSVYALISGKSASTLHLPLPGETTNNLSTGDHVKPRVGPATRLLRLDTSGWVEIPLPEQVTKPGSAPGRLFRHTQGLGLFIAAPDDDYQTDIFVLQSDHSWKSDTVPLPFHDLLALESVPGGMIAAIRENKPAKNHSNTDENNTTSQKPPASETETAGITLVLLHENVVTELFHVQADPDKSSVLFTGPDAVVITDKGNNLPWITTCEIATGRIREEGAFGEPPILTGNSLQPLLLIATMLIASMALIFLKPDPNSLTVVLKPETVPADLIARLAAFIIDLLPAVFVFGFASGFTLEQCLGAISNIVFLQVTVESLPVSVALIALTLIHQVISEAIWGKSLGKLVTGIKVVNTHGEKAKFRQIVIRNALKFVICMVPFLIVFALWNPWRQHLGDWAAGTVVITKAKRSK